MRFILENFTFFFNDTATTEIYTLSLHDALPIYGSGVPQAWELIMSASAFHLSSPARRPGSGWLRRAAACLTAGVLVLVALGAQATPPPAGTSISNQASATYTDSQGVSHKIGRAS